MFVRIVHLRIKRVLGSLAFKLLVSGNADWKQNELYREVVGLGEEKGLLGRAGGERERNKKRERVISPHPASSIFKHESRALPLVPPSLLFLSSSVILPSSFCPFYYLFPFTFLLSSWLASSHPQPHLQYLLHQSNRRGEKQQSWSSFQKITAIKK